MLLAAAAADSSDRFLERAGDEGRRSAQTARWIERFRRSLSALPEWRVSRGAGASMWPVWALMASLISFFTGVLCKLTGRPNGCACPRLRPHRFADDRRDVMKRHPTLQQLSRDHQRASGRLRADAGSRCDRARCARTVPELLAAEGLEHFRQEDEVLLPAFARRGDPRDPIVARVLTDYVNCEATPPSSPRMRIHYSHCSAGPARGSTPTYAAKSGSCFR